MNFWQDKKFLVTGGAGFLGRYVVDKMKERGCENIFIPYQEDYDLVQMAAIKRVYKDANPDIVIHLAAEVGGIGANMENPGRFFYNNLMMGVQMMEEAREIGVEKFVGIGTICSYPKFTSVPFKEEDLWCGYPEETNAPYGMAKKMLIVQGHSYRMQYGFNAIHLLPLNLYGPGDNFDCKSSHVIPALIRKVYEAQKTGKAQISVWGTGLATRGFLYVEDAAEGILLATEKYNKSEPVNLGADMELSIRDLIKLICKLMSFNGEINWDDSKPDGQPRRCLDTQKAEIEFGFKAKISFEEGLKRMIEGYLASQEK